ncbi:MAG: S8 family serine peptidase, partial [Elusimicrobia bacterium]|nr:S8 family serine peptidase [Elusimicrobiota bacterium]
SPRVNLMVRLAPYADPDALRARFPDARLYGPVGGVLSGEVPLSDIARLALDPAVEAAEGARQLKLSLDIARSSINAGGIWYGALDGTSVDFGTNLGSGVVVGFVDSGIDYTHADFYTEGAPNRTRILSIWDQTDAGGPNPSGFAYGSEWTRAQIDDEIDGSPAGVVRQTDTVGHGPHVAGIAAGDGSAASAYPGLAPKADIIMVKSDLANSKVVEGLTYIVNKAAAAGKRAVINLSIGGHFGPHDGKSTFETGVAAVAASTPVVVAMGNEEAESVHASTVVAVSGTSVFTLQADPGVTSLEADFWVPSGDLYTATVSSSATGSTVSCAPGLDCTALSIAGHTIDIYNSPSGHPSGDRQITVDVARGGGFTALTWRVSLLRGANAGSGRVDGYVTSSNSSFTALVDFTGTGSAPATANNVIAVGSYCSRNSWKAFDAATWTDTDCSLAGRLGNISNFSNRGPTRDGRQKPDVAAPGQRIASALSTNQSPAANANVKTPDGLHKLSNGTSMATPVVAGAVARSLEKNVGITAAQVRSNIQAQARTDAKVTAWGAVPNPVFGYGKLRIMGCGDQFSVGPDTAVPSVLGTSSISWNWAALAGATVYKVYYATSPATLIVSTGLPTFLQTSLDVNTTMAIRVSGVNDCGEGPAQDSYSTATLASPLASFAASAHVSSITATWTAVPAGSGYLLQAATATNFSGTLVSSATSVPSVGGLALTGLTAFTTYYVRAGTLNRSGGPHFSPSQTRFTSTTLNPPGAGPFTAVATSSITATWTLNGNSTGLEYLAYAS